MQQRAFGRVAADAPWQAKKKPPRLKKDGTPYKPRRGWGPYRSVPNERAVAFNLQLDVQNLQQEVRNLTALREILQTKTLLQRHSPEGSLCQVVDTYFHVFRKGVALEGPGSKRLVADKYRGQRAFMHSVMDEQVALGHGVYGPDVMMEQMARYSTFLRFICMAGKVDSVAVAEDSVMVAYKGTLQFQVLRSTIEMIFPHVMSNEWLVSQLVGKLVEAPGRSVFHCNAEGKCFKYDVDMDFVSAFMSVVKDTNIVDILLGRALILECAMIGVVDEALGEEEKERPAAVQSAAELVEDAIEPEEEEKAPAPACVETRKKACCCGGSKKGSQQCVPEPRAVSMSESAASPSLCCSREFCQQVVENIVKDYFFAFANGYQEDAVLSSEVSQREFLLQRFASQMQAGVETTVNCVKERWRVLSECFEVLSFQQKGVTQTECEADCNTCLVESSAGYILRITFYTIQSVFPHLVSNMPLLDLLVGKVLVVPSQISFSVEKSSGRISRVNERMDFAAAMAELLPDRQDLEFVISQAFLTKDGVDGDKSTPHAMYSQTPTMEPLQPSRYIQERQDGSRAASRRVRITDILN